MNTKITPKDFFINIGVTIALYASVIALINLVSSIINYIAPDKLATYFSPSNIAWPMSMIIVLVPLLYVLEWYTNKDMKSFPEKRTLWLRRWRIYLTLFLSGATIIGDIIAFINTYLSGEITSRFIYKVLAVLIISAIVFTYYMLDRYEDIIKSTITMKIMAWAGIVIVIASIILGFSIVGSPKTQRMLRFDNEKVSDLQNIQWQVISHWQTTGKMPTKLSDLNDSLSYSNLPNDPETDAPYDYVFKTGNKFSLCANFNKNSTDYENRGSFSSGKSMSMAIDVSGINNGDNWKHEAGYVCFDREIDPQKYPVYENSVSAKPVR